MTTLAGHGKDPRLIQTELPLKKKKSKPSLPKGIKIGDMVTCLEDGTIGQITHLCDRCINIKTADGIQSHSLELGVPKLEIHTDPNQSVVFAIGDRVTLASKNYDFGKFGMGATVISKKWDNKLKLTRISIQFDDGSIETNHFQGAGWFKKLEEEKCLPTLTILAESERSPLQPETLEKSQQLPTSTSAKTRKKSIKPTSLKSQSIPISESISHQKEPISLQGASHVLEPAPQVQKQDSITKSLSSGLNISDVSKKDDPNLQLSKTQQAYSIAEWEQSYKAYPKAGICVSGKLLALPCLEVPKKGKEFLSLPTLTTGLGTGRNAGATKLEKFLKDKLLLQSTQALNPQMMALIFGFPMDWTECLLESPKELEAETTLEPCLEEQSISTVPPSHSNESSILTEFLANNIDTESSSPLERLTYLMSERDRLIAMGASPQGIWIEKSKPAKKPFEQAVWKSAKPRPEWDGKKSKYIGEYGKENHISAIAQHKAGQELRKIEREIKKLQVKS